MQTISSKSSACIWSRESFISNLLLFYTSSSFDIYTYSECRKLNKFDLKQNQMCWKRSMLLNVFITYEKKSTSSSTTVLHWYKCGTSSSLPFPEFSFLWYRSIALRWNKITLQICITTHLNKCLGHQLKRKQKIKDTTDTMESEIFKPGSDRRHKYEKKLSREM